MSRSHVHPRRRLYPMPVETIIDHPDFIAMPAAGRGILFSLLTHFWSTECRPLPKSDRELRSIGRAHVPTWKHWGASVLKVFNDVRPVLESYKNIRDMKATTLSLLGQKTTSKRRAQALTNSATTDQSVAAYAMGILPKKDPNPPQRTREADPKPPRKVMLDRPGTR